MNTTNIDISKVNSFSVDCTKEEFMSTLSSKATIELVQWINNHAVKFGDGWIISKGTELTPLTSAQLVEEFTKSK